MSTSVHDERSWWGWGRRDAALSGAEAGALLARVRALLPDAELADHQPPDPRALSVPPPHVGVPDSLAALASVNQVDRIAHARGKAFRDVARNLAGELGRIPDVVLRPRTEDDVVDVLDWAARADVAVIAYGGGSSVVGGVEPRFDEHAAVATLDLERLNRVLEVDPVSLAARVQAGVYGPRLADQLRPHGLALRHFPQSYEFSTVGGWLATRAGGHFATGDTHIDDLCESLRVVTPIGVSESLRLPASGAGPSPDRLFLGSEGSLGVITQAWLRVHRQPTWRASASVRFGDLDAAVAATRVIAQSGLQPANCRLLDPAEAAINAGVVSGASVLVLGFESADHPVDAWLARAAAIAQDHGGELSEGRASDAATAWRSAFLRMPYQRDVLARHAMIVETFETATTWTAFPQLHAELNAVAADVLREVTGTGLLTCRFTHVYPDGPAAYYGVYAPGRWGSSVAQWDEIKAALSEVISKLGATITHHHAVGRDHRPWYDRQRPDPFAAALGAAKRALDPAGILNPGVLIDSQAADAHH